MRILITGGLGFIGINVAEAFLKQGWDVVLYDSLSARSARANVSRVSELHKFGEVDVVEDNILRIGDRSIPHADAVVHLAANLNQQEALNYPTRVTEVNVLGTQAVLEWCRRTGGVPIIFASTCKVYSTWINSFSFQENETRHVWSDGRIGIGESDELDQGHEPRGMYGTTKRAGELLCEEYARLWGVPVIANRMSSIYGPHQYGSEGYGWVSHFVNAKKQGKPVTIYGTGKQVRDLLHVEDLCRLLVQQVIHLTRGAKGMSVYSVGGGPNATMSVIETIDLLNAFGGSPISVSYGPERPADFRQYVSDIRRVQADFSWTPSILPKQGIEKLYV